ncbi:translocation and assembly module lipoprotein TamL [Rufibacter roseus]|uniref:BamA/TamA family outer membrane protein n=2 Tax=Rufibacter roseus TaxID=1567108 RepID=A0ABW2DSY1_9BACT|nr:BamA/TamA family outer membrane protein [Rufibacter roseus]
MLCLGMGCSPTRHLAEKERLLWKIDLEGVDQTNKSEIVPLYQQTPNRKVLGYPLYLNLYYLGKRFYNPEKIREKIAEINNEYNLKLQKAGSDSVEVDRLIEKKERKLAKKQVKLEDGNWLMRTVGEPPAIFDSLKLVHTEEQIKIYLNAEGFFRSTVTSSTETKKKKVFATITIQEDKPYIISQHTYELADTALLKLLKAPENPSLIQVNKRYDESVITMERARIEQLLKNSGFYDFRQQFVTFTADTSYTDYTVRLKTLVANPTDTSLHKIYSLRNVYFYSDAGLNRFGLTRDTVTLGDVHYLAYNQRVKPRILNRKIILRPGQTYSATRTLNNQRILSNMDMFKFTTISYTKVADSVALDNPRFGLLDAQINTFPLPRYQETTEIGGTFTEGIPGPYASIRFRVRNIFGGAEIFDIGGRAGYEGQYQAGEARAGRRTEIGADMGVTFPQILIPFRTNDILIRYNPRTRFGVGYTYVDRNEYTRTNLDFTYDYIWQRLNIHQFIFSPIDINIISTPRISQSFQQELDRLASLGNPLRQSFNNAFVSSINFTSLYNTANYNQTNDAKLVRIFLESGGFLGQYLAEAFNNLASYKFAKASLDYRRYHPVGLTSMFVYRANGGVAKPIGGSLVLPYDKHFFAGGSSSVRAWLPRRLGPGSSARINRETGEYIHSFEQPGEILLELNSELRFRMFRFGNTNVNGALFLDAGNIWLFEEGQQDTNSSEIIYQPGGEFAFDRFYKELAVGTGFGVRLDFTFAILRFDIATKVYDPARPEGNRYILTTFEPGKLFSTNSQTTFNLGIGYPF